MNVQENEITPPTTYHNRRKWLKLAGFGTLGLGASIGGYVWWRLRGGTDSQVLTEGIPIQDGKAGAGTKKYYPAKLNPNYTELDRPLTERAKAARYCNFYEFSNYKNVWRHVDRFKPFPWQIRVDGLVNKPRTFDIDDLLNYFPLEERRYRHRCVEAWAMAVPWTGFPLKSLLKLVEPLAKAKYVRFVSFNQPEVASNLQDDSYPWPYNEGLTIKEAENDLAFIATGIYGEPLLKQHGAPIRLVVPWKYGFKSAKSIVHIELTEKQPATFWNTVAPDEYGFLANVNPKVPHPRWSQRTERMLGTDEMRETLPYNGYAEQVAHLYS